MNCTSKPESPMSGNWSNCQFRLIIYSKEQFLVLLQSYYDKVNLKECYYVGIHISCQYIYQISNYYREGSNLLSQNDEFQIQFHQDARQSNNCNPSWGGSWDGFLASLFTITGLFVVSFSLHPHLQYCLRDLQLNTHLKSQKDKSPKSEALNVA